MLLYVLMALFFQRRPDAMPQEPVRVLATVEPRRPWMASL